MSRHLIRDLPVVGFFFRDDTIKAAVRALPPGVYPAKLVPEPSNPHDPQALGVLMAPPVGGSVGYVPATVSAFVNYWLESPEAYEATVTVKIGKKDRELFLNVTVNP